MQKVTELSVDEEVDERETGEDVSPSRARREIVRAGKERDGFEKARSD